MELFIVISLIIIGGFLYTWSQLRAGLYVHPANDDSINTKYQLPVEELKVQTSDGINLSCWHLPVKSPKAVVILLHGYDLPKMGKSFMLHHADYLHKAGYAVVMPDFRSFGESEGDKVYFGVKEWMDVEAVFDRVKKDPEYSHIPIGFFGLSYGGSIALVSAGKIKKGDFMIASVPFASFESLFLHEMKRRKFPVWLFLPFIRFAAIIELGFNYQEFAPLKCAREINVPTLIFQSLHDSRLPSEDAQKLHESIPSQYKQLWQADTGHDIHREKPQEFEKRVLDFLEKVIRKK